MVLGVRAPRQAEARQAKKVELTEVSGTEVELGERLHCVAGVERWTTRQLHGEHADHKMKRNSSWIRVGKSEPGFMLGTSGLGCLEHFKA